MSNWDNCYACGHPPSWHRLDDGKNVSPTDPAAEFRCIGYDCEVGGPPPLTNTCNCHNFVSASTSRSPSEERNQ